MGRITGWQEGHGPLVDIPGTNGGPRPARSTVPLDPQILAHAIAWQQEVVLLFEEGDPLRPLILGLVQPMSETPQLDMILEADRRLAGDAESEAPAPSLEAKVDGKRVVVSAEDEISLRCGKATITLRRNGKIVIRGTYVVSRAEGTHRIKGGSVQIN